jgi:hypothetical protein
MSRTPTKLYCDECRQITEVEWMTVNGNVFGYPNVVAVAGCAICSEDVKYLTEAELISILEHHFHVRKKALQEMVEISEEAGLYDEGFLSPVKIRELIKEGRKDSDSKKGKAG